MRRLSDLIRRYTPFVEVQATERTGRITDLVFHPECAVAFLTEVQEDVRTAQDAIGVGGVVPD